MGPDEAHTRRTAAGERLLTAWGIAVVPNTLAAFGVDLPTAWWWHVIRYGLSTLWLVALLMWLLWLWREHRAKGVRATRV